MPADTGLIVGPLENLRSLVAASSNWQTWTATANATDARTHTFLMLPPPAAGEAYTKDELEIQRPFCIVDWFTGRQGTGGEPMSGEQLALGQFVVTAKVFVTFEADTPDEMKAQNSEPFLWFAQKVQGVLTDMLTLQGTGDYLSIQQPTLFAPPRRSPREDKAGIGDLWTCTLLIETGPYIP
jgi:hypothetical protein